jgi:hypothetical protein
MLGVADTIREHVSDVNGRSGVEKHGIQVMQNPTYS